MQLPWSRAMLKLGYKRRAVGAPYGAGKRRSVRSIPLLVALAAGVAWTSASAQERIEVGVLRCNILDPIEAESGAAGAQARDASCVFKLESGTQETYAGKVQVANPSLQWKRTLLWTVKAP